MKAWWKKHGSVFTLGWLAALGVQRCIPEAWRDEQNAAEWYPAIVWGLPAVYASSWALALFWPIKLDRKNGR